MKTDSTSSPQAGREAVKPTHRRLFFPFVSGILVALFLIFLAIVYAMGIELQISDWLLIGIFLLITSCLILILPLVFREAAFRCPIRIYYGYVVLWVLIFFTGAVLVIGAILPFGEKSAARLMCTVNLKRLEVLMNNYADNSAGRYPDPARWCDLLVEQYGAGPDFFICPSAAPAKCHYAVNLNCRPDSPDDVVFLFETKGGWNQHGGPELMVFDHHGEEGCNVLFKSGLVVFVKSEYADRLNWGAEDRGRIKLNPSASLRTGIED